MNEKRKEVFEYIIGFLIIIVFACAGAALIVYLANNCGC